MQTRSRAVSIVLAVGAGLFGLLCLNYTKAFGVEHHHEWARESGLPAPSAWIWYTGLAGLAIGAGLAGWTLGARRR